jgi:succinate dehydrogenase/fumarate reductase flavoprotein subunit
MATLASVQSWAHETDVLVCGFGCAGASAAIEAHDLGGEVLIIEKAPKEHAGGNARVSGQSLLISKNAEALKAYQRAMSTANPIPEDVLDAWAQAMVNLEPWVQQIARDAGATFLRGTGFTEKEAVLEFPELGAREAVAYTATILPIPSGVWLALQANVEQRAVRVLYGARLIDLVQDGDTGEVYGAIVEQDGARIAIRARRGVVMAVGGYEADAQMQRDYYGLADARPLGTPYNTGDGVRILQRAGAQMWHLRNQGQSGGIWPGIQHPDQRTVYLRNFLLPAFSWFDVDATGRRFYGETNELQLTHYKEKRHGRWVDVPLHHAQPVHMIFDETTRTAGKLVLEVMTWSAVVADYVWSDDNSAEMAAGLIVSADTIEDLGVKIGLDPAVLAAETATYNAACAAGVDEGHGRRADSLLPVATGPFHALPIVPAIVCTGGGARRDADGRVFDHAGGFIPRLFEAGELGSIFSDLYQNGSYLTEAMISGRAAARTALSQTRWTEVGPLAPRLIAAE